MPDITYDLTVTGRQIADALEGLPVAVEVEPGVARSPRTDGWLAVIEGTVSKPGAIAAAILSQVPGFGQPVQAEPCGGCGTPLADGQSCDECEGVVRLAVKRDVLLQVLGWVSAHRPPAPDDWEPPFLGAFLTAAGDAVKSDT